MNPDEIAKAGTPETAWITPDGKFITTDAAEAKANGATHQVSAANVTFADGRKQWIVYSGADRSHAPGTFSPAGPPLGIDATQQRIYQQGQTAATRGDQEGDIRGPQTGPTREVYRGGKWVVEQNPVYQPPAGSGASDWRTEGRPDGQGGYDNSRPIMVRTVNGKREEREPTGAELKDWNEAQQRQRNPGGRLDSEIKADKDKEEAANKPTTTVKEDASGQLVSIQTFPDGRKPVITPLGVQGTPQQVKGPDGVTYERKPDGSYAPVAGIAPPTAAEPAGAPRPNTNYGQAAAGLTQYRDFLNTQVELNRTSGGRQGITPQQADKLMETRLAQVKLTMEEQQGVVSTQTQMYGQQVSQRGQTLTDTAGRRTAAGNNYSTVLSNFMPLLKYMPKGGGEAFMRLLTGAVNYGQDQTAAWGGMRESPEIQYGPAAQAANRAPMPGQTSSSGTMAPYAPPTPAPAATPPVVPPPNAAEVEAARQATMATNQAAHGAGAAPVPPVGAAVAPAPVAAPNPYGPQPQEAARPGDASIMPPSINPVTGEPTGLVPLPTSVPAPVAGPVPGQDPNQWTPPADPWTAPQQPNTPTWETYRPVPGQVAPPDPAFPDAPQSMMPTAAPSFLNAYSQPPRPRSLDLLINDPDIPNEIVAEAYRRVYGRTPSLVG